MKMRGCIAFFHGDPDWSLSLVLAGLFAVLFSALYGELMGLDSLY